MLTEKSKMNSDPLYQELRTFFGACGGTKCIYPPRLERTRKCKEYMDRFAAEHPEADSLDLRREIYRVLRREFLPILFPDSPFYCEMGGNGGWNVSGLGAWLFSRQVEVKINDPNPEAVRILREANKQNFYYGYFVDVAHNAPPIPNILKSGFKGIYEEALATLPRCRTEAERRYTSCVIEGLETVKIILEQYAEAAHAKLEQGGLNERQRKFMTMIAESAPVVPWEPPRTFYEALNCCWFVREIMGEMDSVRTNALGRPDAWLIDYYRQDLATGRLTEAEAYDLVYRFLLLGDALYDHDSTVEKYSDHENEITFTLGGCDEQGKEVFNELTELFLRVYRENNMIYPKPHCRFSSSSSSAYLRLITDDILAGRGVYTLNNDDCIIPALIKDGKSVTDARDYCVTGCWDLVVLGREDNAGGNYFNLVRVLEATIHDSDENLAKLSFQFERLDDAGSFEECYARLMKNVQTVLKSCLTLKGTYGKLYPEAVPAPLNSGCSSDCLHKRKDFMAGGQRYNPHAISLCGFANFVDSLLSLRELCFLRKKCSVHELLTAVRHNWASSEELRAEVLKCPHWGDNRKETVELARRIYDDLYQEMQKYENARGGKYQLGIWIYREFRYWGEKTKALPDGRYSGDIIAQSLNPSHFRCQEPITTVLQCLASLDLTLCAGNSVVNLLLDRSTVTPETAEALVRTFARLNLQLLQLNCASREELLDAQKHPEKHPNLMIRLCGFSAKFVALSPEWQQEVIRRNRF